MKNNFTNEMYDIDCLPLNEDQKKYVLEYFARRCIDIIYRITGDNACNKIYDPLVIEGNIAHSYAFDFEDGGRYHPFKNLEHLEEMLINNTVSDIKDEFLGCRVLCSCGFSGRESDCVVRDIKCVDENLEWDDKALTCPKCKKEVIYKN